MRAKKTLFLFFFLFCLTGSFLNLLNFNFYNSESPPGTYISNDAIPVDAEILNVFNETGDFVDWEVTQIPGGANKFYWNNTGDHLLFGMRTVNTAETARAAHVLYPNNASTNVMGFLDYNITIFYDNFIAVSEDYEIEFNVYYSDLTSDTFLLISETVPAWGSGADIYVPNFTLDADKEVFFYEIYMSQDRYLDINVTLWDEMYLTQNLPKIDVNRIPNENMVHPQDLITFFANVSHQIDLDYIGLEILYYETGNSHEYIMNPIWELDNAFETAYTPRYEGIYYYLGVFHLNFWGLDVYSNLSYFGVYETGFPASSYLSLYSSLDGFPLDSKDFKIYLGEDEEYSLVNFIDYYGNWSKIFDANLTASFIDNYIRFSTVNSGLKTRFENDGIVNTLVYNVLLFEIKVESPCWLNIMYNPAIYEKGYYLYFNSSEVDYWYSVIVPFFNFTTYKDVTGDLLYELGFWINTGTVNLANIRAAKYYNPNFSIEILNYTKTQGESEILSPVQTSEWYNASLWLNNSYSLTCERIDSQENDSIENNLAAIASWNNLSTYLEETNFNHSGFQSANITIANNETIGLNLTNDYLAAYSFTSDTNGANPEGWNTDETGAIDISVIESYLAHHKVIYYADFSTTTRGDLWNDFAAQSGGAIEFWIAVNDSTRRTNIHLWNTRSSGTWATISIGEKAGWLQAFSGSWQDICQIHNDQWYHFRITFECASGGFDGLAADKYNLYVNTTKYGPFSFATAGNTFGCLEFVTYPSAQQSIRYIDAVDYSWSIDYFTNRNYNDTYYPKGVYLSPVYDLGNVDCFFYDNFDYSCSLVAQTNLTLEYRSSFDNSTFSSWGLVPGNFSINQYEGQYFQFRANLTTWGNYTFSPKLFWANLSFSLCDLLGYSVNESYAFDLGQIEKRNIENIFLNTSAFYSVNANYTDYSVLTNGSTSGSIENINLDDSQYFRILDQSDPPPGGTPEEVMSWLYLNFTLDFTVNTFYIDYNLIDGYYASMGWVIYNGLIQIKDQASGNWVTVKTIPNQYNTNEKLFINNTGNHFIAGNLIEIRFVQTVRESHTSPGNYGSYFAYFFVNLITSANLYLWDFENSVYMDAFGFNLTNQEVGLQYFNGSTILGRVYCYSPSNFALNFSLSFKINYYYFQNASYVYEFDLNESTIHFYHEFLIDFILENNTSLNFYWRASSNEITWSDWNDSLIIEAIGARYLSIRVDCNTSYLYNTSYFYWANCSYSIYNRTFYYVLNYTKVFNLAYNKSCYLLSAGIYSLSLNLTVNNETIYQFYTYDFNSGLFCLNESSNFTDCQLFPDFYNLTQFQIRFFSNSTLEYTLNYSVTLERDYYEIWNLSYYTANNYRLISDSNRQNPNNLIFEQWYETIVIVDFFGNVLYRKLHLYSNFTDIRLSIFTLTVINNHNYTILSRVERGLGVYLEFAVPPESSFEVRIFATNYRLEIRNLELQLLNVTSLSANSSKSKVIEVGKREEFAIPSFDFWALLKQFFFGSWYGILLFLLIVTSLIILIADFIMNLKRRKEEKRQKRIRKLKKSKWDVIM